LIAAMNSLRLVLLSLAGLAGAATLVILLPAHTVEAVARLLDHRPAPLQRQMPVFARAGADDARFVSAEFSPIGVAVEASRITLIYGDGDVPPEGSICYPYPRQARKYVLRLDGDRSVRFQALTAPKAFCISEQTQPVNF
jgi:hypothetical protein